MIYNRTNSDVETSKKIISEKVQKGFSLTDEEISMLEKGTITINTINRIESKTKELKNIFDVLFYKTHEIDSKEWNYEDIFDNENFERILSNIKILQKSFLVFSETPKHLYISYDFSNINNIEKSLYDLDKMIEDIRENYRQCGNFQCGEV